MADYVNEAINAILKNDSTKDYIAYGDTDSAYFNIDDVVKAFQEKNPNASIQEITDFCDNLDKKYIQPKVQEFIEMYAEELNAYDKSMIGAEREVISDRSVFVAAKKYMMRVRDNEGARFPDDDPYIKVQGLEVIKGGTPQFSKEHLRKAIPEILDSDELRMRDYVREKKAEYLNYGLSAISQTQGVSRVDYSLGDKGVPQGSRCALVYNDYIKNNNLLDKYVPINGGDRIKKVFLLTPNKFNSDVIGYIDDNFVKEIEPEIIDYDTMFEKGFLNMLELMTEPMKWNIRQETESLDDW